VQVWDGRDVEERGGERENLLDLKNGGLQEVVMWTVGSQGRIVDEKRVKERREGAMLSSHAWTS